MAHRLQSAELASRLATVQAQIADLHEQAAAAEHTVAETVSAHDDATTKAGLLRAARSDWDTVTATLARVASAREDIERRRAAYVERERELQTLDSRLDKLQREQVDWQFFAKAFGREGLPVLEIDAAGPTVSSLCNQLLEACFGSRFSIEFVTQAVKTTKGKDGSQFKEAFTIRIIDNERGGESRDIADLSGGEQIVVDEALKASLAIFCNTRSEMPIRTCFRDETIGPLDPANADRYMQMLRKLRELGGFRHLLFVSHNADAAATADAQIRVAGGAAQIVLPPYAEAA